jgi:hypothetical protein
VAVSGFGDSIHEALRELAKNLIREGVWIEIPGEGKIDMTSLHLSSSGTIQTDTIELHRFDEGRMVAVVCAPAGRHAAAGSGESLHEALRALPNELVAQGIWVEVAGRREWRFVEPPATMLACGLRRCGLLRAASWRHPKLDENVRVSAVKFSSNQARMVSVLATQASCASAFRPRRVPISRAWTFARRITAGGLAGVPAKSGSRKRLKLRERIFRRLTSSGLTVGELRELDPPIADA